jgi:hypothetical protein
MEVSLGMDPLGIQRVLWTTVISGSFSRMPYRTGGANESYHSMRVWQSRMEKWSVKRLI